MLQLRTQMSYLSHYDLITHSYFDMTSQLNIQSPPILKDLWFATFFH
jgi:hypothetical protein